MSCLEEIKFYKVMEKIFNQMAAKAKKSEVKELLLKPLVAFLEPSQISKMELFVKIVNGIKLLTIFTKVSILDV